MYAGLHVKYRYCCQILVKLEISRQMFEKYSNIKFHENPSSGSRVVPADAHTDTDRQTDKTKLIVAVRNFANAPTISLLPWFSQWAAIVSLNSLGWLFFVTGTWCVFCEYGSEVLQGATQQLVWWTDCRSDSCLSQYLGFPLSLPLRQCSVLSFISASTAVIRINGWSLATFEQSNALYYIYRAFQ